MGVSNLKYLHVQLHTGNKAAFTLSNSVIWLKYALNRNDPTVNTASTASTLMLLFLKNDAMFDVVCVSDPDVLWTCLLCLCCHLWV